MAFTPPPIPPNSGDPANFNGRADAFLGWFPGFVTELNAAGYPNLPSRSLADGTAAAPMWTWDADPDTGVYRPGANQWAVATGGVQRLLLSTTALTTAVPIVGPSGSAGAPAYSVAGDLNTGMFFPAADTIAWATGGTERLRLTTAGLLTSTTAITQSPTDTTAGRLTKVGDFGIGGHAVSVTDLNAIDAGGAYTISQANAAAGNAPDGISAWSVLAWVANGTNQTQIATRYGAGGTSPFQYIRVQKANVWLAWVPIVVGELTQSATDATAGRITKVGDFGIGAISVPSWPNASVNDISGVSSGIYGVTPTMGAPAFGTMVFAKRLASSNASQELISSSGVYVRAAGVITDGVASWASWGKLISALDIIGTVAQSSGVPTGAIIERGSNANGEYVRFADGTQICWRATAMTTNPAAFSGTPVDIDGAKMRIGRWF